MKIIKTIKEEINTNQTIIKKNFLWTLICILLLLIIDILFLRGVLLINGAYLEDPIFHYPFIDFTYIIINYILLFIFFIKIFKINKESIKNTKRKIHRCSHIKKCKTEKN